jgi:uncharacterized protein YecE (DUF72 family)
MREGIHIGTSGWSYAHWRNLFYPRGFTSAKWLSFYAGHYDVTEINGSFYRLPTVETVLKWKENVPDGFLFCPKMSRYLTHMKKLREAEEPLLRFFSVFDVLEDRMGPILVQLPPQLRFQPALAENFYQQLQQRYGSYRFSVEVREPGWLQEESLALMERYGVGFVISEAGGAFPYSEAITANHVYFRLHGPGALYASSYSDVQLEAIAAKLKGWKDGGHSLWVFFNNDIHGYAVGDARRLKELVEGQGR